MQTPLCHTGRLLTAGLLLLFFAGHCRAETPAPAENTEPARAAAGARTPPDDQPAPFSFTLTADAAKTDFSARCGLRFSNDDLKTAAPRLFRLLSRPGSMLSALLSPLTPSGARRLAGGLTRNSSVNLSGVQFRPYRIWQQVDYYWLAPAPPEAAPSAGQPRDRQRFDALGTAAQMKILLAPLVEDVKTGLSDSLAEQAFDRSVGTANPRYRETVEPGEKRRVVTEIERLGRLWPSD
ncbi:MAG: hypothetical protein PHW69_07555 [Elusimicrobiaceae bacterium]|nr:hypothetical protein [Elusimicrobiaceae bacterium]